MKSIEVKIGDKFSIAHKLGGAAEVVSVTDISSNGDYTWIHYKDSTGMIGKVFRTQFKELLENADPELFIEKRVSVTLQ